ncbi:MAG: Mrp/NBP35 family ATP-binding protein [Endomicrobiales bacterium]|nr:Mrp/NBP35 family ATP-binding protein [Endomicrobiales bacterium]
MDAQVKEKEREQRLQDRIKRIKNKIMVFSGKGGVGKTTVAVNLACGLADRGFKVGIMDVDVHGPNVAKMLGIEGKRLAGSETGIEPVTVLPNLKAVSMALLMENQDQPIIWRGPMKMNVIKQFLSDMDWGDLDYLIVDSPPGTGDEPLSVCQLIPGIDCGLVVTTPQDVAILDARKSILFARELKIRLIGVVENMSGFVCPHCKKEIELFGKGSAERSARELGAEFFGSIPMDPGMIKLGDSGKPAVHENNEISGIFNGIIDRLIERIRDIKQ